MSFFTTPHREAGETGPTPPLVVATVFEDGVTAQCARRLMGRILGMTGSEMAVEECTWSFCMLDQPDGMAAAARQAAGADVLVVAAWRDSAALVRAIEWLQHWVGPRRDKHGALVSISIEREVSGHLHEPMENRLADVARQIGMDFFATHVPPSAEFLRGENAPPSPYERQIRVSRFFPSHDQARPDRR